MTNEERLEIIKNESLIDALIYQLDMNLEGPKELVKDVRWLIEQAELLQVFSKKNVELNVFLQKRSSPKNLGRNVIDVVMDTIEELTVENARLRKALNFYADGANYEIQEAFGGVLYVPVERDKGERATRALAGEPDD